MRPTRRHLAVAIALLVATLLSTPPTAAAPPPQVTTLVAQLDGAVGGVAVDRLGNVFVADFGSKVWRVTPWGDVEVLVSGLYGTSGNAVDGEGNLLQSSFHGNYLSRVHRDGRVERVAAGLEGPVGVAVGDGGDVFVTNCRGNWIARVDAGGEVHEHARSDLFQCPNGLARDGDGNLYALNFNDTRILKVTPGGEVTVHAVLPGSGGGHLVFTGDRLYATTFRGHQLHRVALDGTVTTVAGSGRFAVEDGAGEAASFASPNGIGWDANRNLLYVNDYPVPLPERRSTRPTSALRRIALPSLTATLSEALDGDGGSIDAMEAAYREFREGSPVFTQVEMNRFGYGLLRRGNVEAALRAFELNAESYPDSFNVWDSLAEAHKEAGNRERAIELYRKSLAINPGNDNARTMLGALGAEP